MPMHPVLEQTTCSMLRPVLREYSHDVEEMIVAADLL